MWSCTSPPRVWSSRATSFSTVVIRSCGLGQWPTIAACDRVLGLGGVTTVVPGHGPVAGREALADLKGYFEYLTVEARLRFDAGMTPLEASRDLDLGPYRDWGQRERLVVNINALYRDFGADVPSDPVTLFTQMSELGTG